MVDEASRISSLDLYEDLLYNDSKQGKCFTIQEVGCFSVSSGMLCDCEVFQYNEFSNILVCNRYGYV